MNVDFVVGLITGAGIACVPTWVAIEHLRKWQGIAKERLDNEKVAVQVIKIWRDLYEGELARDTRLPPELRNSEGAMWAGDEQSIPSVGAALGSIMETSCPACGGIMSHEEIGTHNCIANNGMCWGGGK